MGGHSIAPPLLHHSRQIHRSLPPPPTGCDGTNPSRSPSSCTRDTVRFLSQHPQLVRLHCMPHPSRTHPTPGGQSARSKAPSARNVSSGTSNELSPQRLLTQYVLADDSLSSDQRNCRPQLAPTVPSSHTVLASILTSPTITSTLFPSPRLLHPQPHLLPLFCYTATEQDLASSIRISPS